MYNIDIYNTKIEDNNMVYSIDKIRLKTYITFQQFKDLEDYFKLYHNNKIKKFWLSDKISSFYYNYNIEIEEGKSFVFQFLHNSESFSYDKIENVYNFTIEFNPNKLRNNYLVLHILNSFSFWYLRSFDLAIDIPINILDILFDKNRKRSYKIFSSGGDNLTYYIGTKDKDGSIKIYNKKIESDLKIVGNLTRIEITRKYDDLPISGIKSYDFGEQFLPLLFLNQYIFSFSDITSKDKTLLAILYSVQSGFPLSELSRRYRDKIKDMLESGSRIQFNKKIASQALLQCIFYYFVTEKSIQIIL